ncbi:MAG: hypothetical protein WA005_05640 [Candidatus Binataceae bacterium]
MQKLTIVLPDAAYSVAEKEARQANIDVSTLCAMKLSDVLIARQNGTSSQGKTATPVLKASIEPHAANRSMSKENLTLEDLRAVFGSYPEKSRRYAERVFEEVCKFPGVTAKLRPGGRGVIFDPNFVSIEYLRRRNGGVALSLGAPTRRYRNPPESLKRGRTESYSWIMLDSEEALERVSTLLKQTWDFRYENHKR